MFKNLATKATIFLGMWFRRQSQTKIEIDGYPQWKQRPHVMWNWTEIFSFHCHKLIICLSYTYIFPSSYTVHLICDEHQFFKCPHDLCKFAKLIIILVLILVKRTLWLGQWPIQTLCAKGSHRSEQQTTHERKLVADVSGYYHENIDLKSINEI